VKGRVVALADVAILGFDDFAKIRLAIDVALLEAGRRINIWGGENRFTAQGTNTSLSQKAVVALQPIRLALALFGFEQPPPLGSIGAGDAAGRLEQTRPVLSRNCDEQRAVLCNGLQEVAGGAQALGERSVVQDLNFAMMVGSCCWDAPRTVVIGTTVCGVFGFVQAG
jgi:hypothetical protein